MLPRSPVNALPSKLQKITLQLRVSLILGPEVERDRCHLIHDRFGQSAFRKVHCLDIAPATVATFHADVLEFFRGVDRKLSGIFFPTSRTHDPPELPFRHAK